MKQINLLFLFIGTLLSGQETETKTIAQTLDAWHTAAGTANFDAYFDLMTKDAVFIGTDAGENWQRSEFMQYAKPHFDNGKAWNFTAVERNIYVGESHDFAWFDELLDTQMKICRGSGVLRKVDGRWKIAHYVLSIAVPNENVAALVQLKAEKDSLFLKQLKTN